jgi:hypothetical protein
MKSSIQTYNEVESQKTVVTSIFASGAKSPESLEEFFSALDKIGIEWYVTEKGTLMIKYWQIGAEDFVPSEQVAVIRSDRPSPDQGDELDWLSKNLPNVRGRYGGQWVAVYNNEIIAAAPDLPDLIRQIGGFDRPLITFIPAEPVVWTFTYAS